VAATTTGMGKWQGRPSPHVDLADLQVEEVELVPLSPARLV